LESISRLLYNKELQLHCARCSHPSTENVCPFDIGLRHFQVNPWRRALLMCPLENPMLQPVSAPSSGEANPCRTAGHFNLTHAQRGPPDRASATRPKSVGSAVQLPPDSQRGPIIPGLLLSGSDRKSAERSGRICGSSNMASIPQDAIKLRPRPILRSPHTSTNQRQDHRAHPSSPLSAYPKPRCRSPARATSRNPAKLQTQALRCGQPCSCDGLKCVGRSQCPANGRI